MEPVDGSALSVGAGVLREQPEPEHDHREPDRRLVERAGLKLLRRDASTVVTAKSGTDFTTNTPVEPTTWIASAAPLPLVVW